MITVAVSSYCSNPTGAPKQCQENEAATQPPEVIIMTEAIMTFMPVWTCSGWAAWSLGRVMLKCGNSLRKAIVNVQWALLAAS